jgi:type VI secretion system ImpA family protein
MINAEELLEPISADAPCGEDLSYDASLQELETMARGKEETQFSAAEPPDWKKLQARCLEFFARSKDLRIAMTLAVASMELDGLAGFREILLLVSGLVQRFWPTVYPQLDPSDDNDPLQRMNISPRWQRRLEHLVILSEYWSVCGLCLCATRSKWEDSASGTSCAQKRVLRRKATNRL